MNPRRRGGKACSYGGYGGCRWGCQTTCCDRWAPLACGRSTSRGPGSPNAAAKIEHFCLNNHKLVQQSQPDQAFHIICLRLRARNLRISLLALNDVRQCVMRHLHDISIEVQGQRVVAAPVTRQFVADRIGASRKMVSRTFKQLATSGQIQQRQDGSLLLHCPAAWATAEPGSDLQSAVTGLLAWKRGQPGQVGNEAAPTVVTSAEGKARHLCRRDWRHKAASRPLRPLPRWPA